MSDLTESTAIGRNRTGMQMSPLQSKKMSEIPDDIFSLDPAGIDTDAIAGAPHCCRCRVGCHAGREQ